MSDDKDKDKKSYIIWFVVPISLALVFIAVLISCNPSITNVFQSDKMAEKIKNQ